LADLITQSYVKVEGLRKIIEDELDTLLTDERLIRYREVFQRFNFGDSEALRRNRLQSIILSPGAVAVGVQCSVRLNHTNAGLKPY
jgi:hypothetical protein